MLSKHVTKIIQNLEKKKFRDKYNLFKIEGNKLVEELLISSFNIDLIAARPQWIESHANLLNNKNVTEVDEIEMKNISDFQSIPDVIATAQIPTYSVNHSDIENSLIIALNGIQDPGNLGTIIRVADWFGIRHIFCDSDCANVFNPKCVQASMGAIFRVQVHYVNLPDFLTTFDPQKMPKFGTFLNGENIYASPMPKNGIIIMGNEGRGIRPDIEALVDRKITIPSFAENEFSTESLNVGVATGIILSEFRRNLSK